MRATIKCESIEIECGEEMIEISIPKSSSVIFNNPDAESIKPIIPLDDVIRQFDKKVLLAKIEEVFGKEKDSDPRS